jgi:hypothetical protein
VYIFFFDDTGMITPLSSGPVLTGKVSEILNVSQISNRMDPTLVAGANQFASGSRLGSNSLASDILGV